MKSINCPKWERDNTKDKAEGKGNHPPHALEKFTHYFAGRFRCLLVQVLEL